jgi:hypothetical protein
MSLSLPGMGLADWPRTHNAEESKVGGSAKCKI